MRVMVIVKATKNSEAGKMPSAQAFADMGMFNEELVKAGIMLDGDGLKPSSKGKRVHFSSGKKTVIDGPFTETKELLAGFWIVQGKSMEEIVERFTHAPFDGGGTIEIRPFYEMEDLGDTFTPEMREQVQKRGQQIGVTK